MKRNPILTFLFGSFVLMPLSLFGISDDMFQIIDTIPLETFQASLNQLQAELATDHDTSAIIDLELKELQLLEKEKSLLMREQRLIYLEQNLSERMIQFEQQKLAFKEELEQQLTQNKALVESADSFDPTAIKKTYRIQFFASAYRDKSFPELSSYGSLITQDRGNMVIYMLLVDDPKKLENVRAYYTDAFILD